MGVIGAPLGRKRWEAAAIEAGLRDQEGRHLAAPDVAAMLTEALACGQAEDTPYGPRCAPQHAFATFREAALVEGRLREWQRVVLAALEATAGPQANRWQLDGAAAQGRGRGGPQGAGVLAVHRHAGDPARAAG
jgi:hypothetical protein